GQRDDRAQRRLARGVRRHGEHPDARFGELAQRRERDDRRAVRGGPAAARPRLTAAPAGPPASLVVAPAARFASGPSELRTRVTTLTGTGLHSPGRGPRS